MRTRSAVIALVSALMLAALPAGTAAAQTTDLDCSDFDFQEEAQAAFEAIPGDPYHLDGDGNGVACESLPHEGAATTTTTVPPTTVPPTTTSAAAATTTTSAVATTTPATATATTTTTAAPAATTTAAAPTSPAAAAVDRDCPDFPTQAAAQAAFDAVPGDPERLDADHDGIACEDNFGTSGRQVTVVPSGAPNTGGTGAG